MWGEWQNVTRNVIKTILSSSVLFVRFTEKNGNIWYCGIYLTVKNDNKIDCFLIDEKICM